MHEVPRRPPDGIERYGDKEQDANGDTRHAPWSDGHGRSSCSPFGAHETDDGPDAAGNNDERVPHVGFDQKQAHHSQSREVSAGTLGHHPCLEQEEYEEWQGNVRVPQDQKLLGTESGRHCRLDGYPGQDSTEATGAPRQARGERHGQCFECHLSTQGGPGGPSADGGQWRLEPVEEGAGMAPAHPAIGTGERGQGPERPDIVNSQVEDGRIAHWCERPSGVDGQCRSSRDECCDRDDDSYRQAPTVAVTPLALEALCAQLRSRQRQRRPDPEPCPD